jgi:hypothetical protein
MSITGLEAFELGHPQNEHVAERDHGLSGVQTPPGACLRRSGALPNASGGRSHRPRWVEP